MAKNSKIEWTDHTFNPWWGCDRVSPACDDCYAAAWAHRLGMDHLWAGDRRFFGDAHWAEPLKWDRQARESGVTERVFCASMADVFDNHPAVEPHRQRLWNLIRSTQNLIWLLLTKRIGLAEQAIPRDLVGDPRIWIGATIVTEKEARRDIHKLQDIDAYVRFLSCEPLVEEIRPNLDGIGWVICGGESGRKARPLEPQWAVDLLERCREHKAAFFMKQGSQANWGAGFKDINTFPPELRVREFPATVL